MNNHHRYRHWPWLTLQIIAANAAIIAVLAVAWYLTFMRHSSVYSQRLMTTFNIEPGSLHAMYVDDVERQLWISVIVGLIVAIVASVGLALLILRPLRSLAQVTQRLRHGDFSVRARNERGEVGQLAENFNALAVALDQEERRRAQFMADLGHELRTPIMSLQGYTEGLEDGVFKADKGYFRLMAGELSHLTMLTHTIETMQLDNIDEQLAGIESAIAIGDLLENARQGWVTRFEQRDLDLLISLPAALADIRLPVSPNALKQIVDNLLSNMIRYASSEGLCKIEVDQVTKAGQVVFKFSNEAPDVTEQELPFLFDRFYRISRSRTRVTNEHPSGLGLSVVRQLCISSGGSVSASLDGSRLLITLCLPVES